MLEKNFRNVTPYVPGDQPRFADMVKLNTNENPYPPAESVVKASMQFDTQLLKLYPPTDAGDLRVAIAEYHHVDKSRVFVGVGSDDVIAVIFQTCFNSGKPLLFPDITYSFYEVWAEMYGVPYKKVTLRPDFTVNAEDYCGGEENGGIIIANPNAPTGIALPISDVEKIIAANRERFVIIDEAYVDFGGESAMELIDKYDNLVVVRTFSKSRSMAGLRIGYAIGSQLVIKAMDDIKSSVNSYTLNWPAIEMGKASIAEEDYFRETIRKIVATRGRLVDGLEKLGFTVLPSATNFVFARHESMAAKQIYEELVKRHIYVRFFNKQLIDNFLRITVGTDAEIDRLFSVLREIL